MSKNSVSFVIIDNIAKIEPVDSTTGPLKIGVIHTTDGPIGRLTVALDQNTTLAEARKLIAEEGICEHAFAFVDYEEKLVPLSEENTKAFDLLRGRDLLVSTQK